MKNISGNPIAELSDLPNFKTSFVAQLNEMGIASLADLREALSNEAGRIELMEKVVGIGPKTIQSWQSALLEPSAGSEKGVRGQEEQGVIPAEVEEVPLDSGAQEPSEVKVEDQGSVDHELVESDDAPSSSTISGEISEALSLSCNIDDAYEMRQILIDLLKWNGAKKKGLASTIAFMENRLKGAKLDVSLVKDEDDDPVALVATRGKGGLVLWGHLDTAPEGDMESDLQGVVVLDFVYGRGAVDMRGALAALTWAAQRMSDWDIPYTIVLTTDALKEQAGAQMVARDPLVAEGKGVLMLAPTGMVPSYGQAGYVAMNITVAGEGSIIDASRLISDLSRSDPLLPDAPWLRVGLIRGGKKKDPFGPAASCQTSLEILTAGPTDDAVRMVMNALSNKDHVTEILRRVEPLGLEPDSPLVQEAEEFLGKKARLLEVSTEACHVAPFNSNICICGPGSSIQTRAPNEHVVLTDLEKMFEMIVTMVHRS